MAKANARTRLSGMLAALARHRAWCALIAIALVLGIIACAAIVRAPQPLVVKELAPAGGDAAERPEARALAVVHFGPEGPADARSSVTLVFNQPLRVLAAEDDAVELPLSIEPEVQGQWTWVGSSAVQFSPAQGRLPFGTRFRVAVGAGFRALGGAVFERPFEFGFETPAPKLIGHSPADGQLGLPTDARIELRFDQPVVAADVERLGRLSVGGAPREFRVEAQNEAIVVTPKAPLPRHSRVEFELLAGLRGSEGPLPSTLARRFAFETYGPLRATLACGWGGCIPGNELRVELSNPVRVRDIQARLSIRPKVELRFPEWLDADDWTSTLSVHADLLPRTTYVMSLAPGAVDAFGQRLGKKTQQSITVGDYEPSLVLGMEGEILEPSRVAGLRLKTLNTGKTRLTTVPLGPGDAAEFADRRWEFPGAETLPASRTVWLDGGLDNRTKSHSIDLLGILGQKPQLGGVDRGALLVEVENSRGYRDVRTQLIQITDLALSGKLSRQGSLLWVTRLSTGKPVAGARVSIWQGARELAHFTSDGDGFVTVPTTAFQPLFYDPNTSTALVAQLGSDWTVRSAQSFLSPWSYSPSPNLGPVQPLTAFLFTDRGIYRPGDEVWLKSVVRRRVEPGTPEARGPKGPGQHVVQASFDLRLHSPNGEVVLERRVETNEFGTLANRLRVPASAALGIWRAVLRPVVAKGEEPPEFEVAFDVAEYRPSEFEVTAQKSRDVAVNGETGNFSARGTYLFGAPMAGASVHYVVSTEPTSFTPPGSDGWVTNDWAYESGHTALGRRWLTLARGDTVLDAAGDLTLPTKFDVPTQEVPLRVRFEAEVTDISRQTVAASTSSLLLPAAYVLGIQQPEDALVSAPAKLTPKILAFAPNGERVAGRPVTLELVRRRWTSLREGSGGTARITYKQLEEQVSRCTLTTQAAASSCALSVTQGGLHVVRATSTDARGRTTHSSIELYALGKGLTSWRDDSEGNVVELVPNRTSYRVGDVAKVLVKSPFQRAEALVTLERAGVLEHRRITLEGPTPTLEVPITESMRPNVYVGVHLLKERQPGAADDAFYRVGYAELSVDPELRRLSVNIRPEKEELRPGDEVVAHLEVKDADQRGKRAELTFYAVDEGVLMLTGYQLPDPVPVFTAPRPLQVATLESRADLGRLLEPELGANKGDEGGGGGGDRSVFKQSAHFAPSIVTDDKGRAQVRFKLPDNLTTFRLMAVAVTSDDRYGSGQSQVKVNKPLMARPALPRFLRAGDDFEASVVVSTRGARSKQVEVRARAKGLELVGPSKVAVEVEPTGTREVRFQARALHPGPVELHFEVKGSVERDSVTQRLRVESPAQLEVVAAYGETEAVEAQRLGKLDKVRGDLGGLQVTLASTRLVGLDASIEQLVEYPYQCTEQLSSRLLPLLPLRELAKTFGFELPGDSERLAADTAREITKRQRGDGGFGYWPESLRSDPWLTGYALWTLKLATQHGVRVDESVFQRGIKYLKEDLSSRAAEVQSRVDDKKLDLRDDPDLLAFAAFVLVELGEADLGQLERLAALPEGLRTDGLAWLSMAAVRAKAPDTLSGPLFEKLSATLALDGNRVQVVGSGNSPWLLTSDTRTRALVLSALLANRPDHPLAGRLATDLLGRRVGGSWRTTQESAFTLLALDAYRRAQEKDTPDFRARVWVGDEVLVDQRFAGRSTRNELREIPMQRLKQAGSLDVVFERADARTAASGRLFYEARLEYASVELPKLPLDRGFGVEKTVRPATSAELSEVLSHLGPSHPEVPAGALVVVDLLVTTSVERHFVVIDDPLPAGFEAIDSKLATSSGFVQEAGAGAPRIGGFSTAWHRKELRDQRALFFADELAPGLYHFRYLARATTLGDFVVPPTRVLEMYQPEVYGRTAAQRLRVVAPVTAVSSKGATP